MADLSELARLTDTAGAIVVGRVWQERDRPDPATLHRPGKAEEVSREAKRLSAGTIVFDDELSPAQIRNLEKTTEAKVIDRSAVILDIFARRARNARGEDPGGARPDGIPPPAPDAPLDPPVAAGGRIGEPRSERASARPQLELDRRLIRRKIARLKTDLGRIEKGRAVRRMDAKDLQGRARGLHERGQSRPSSVPWAAKEHLSEDRLFRDASIRRLRRCTTREARYISDRHGRVPAQAPGRPGGVVPIDPRGDGQRRSARARRGPRPSALRRADGDDDEVLAEMGVLDRPHGDGLNKADAVVEPASSSGRAASIRRGS